jgi:hypothetical protein
VGDDGSADFSLTGPCSPYSCLNPEVGQTGRRAAVMGFDSWTGIGLIIAILACPPAGPGSS